MAPVAGARRFVAKLRSVSRAPVFYAEIPGAQHAFELFPSVRTEAALLAIKQFCRYAALRALNEPVEARGGVADDALRGRDTDPTQA